MIGPRQLVISRVVPACSPLFVATTTSTTPTIIMSGDEIPMDVFSSSSPSEGSMSCSTGPTTPSASPLFRPSEFDDLKLAALPQSRVLSETELPSIAVKNVCVIGAGYVGTFDLSKSELQ